MAGMNTLPIVDPQRLVEFCREWKIEELALFGSILREDFGSESDIDFLVRFHSEARWSLIDHIRIENELERILGRPVDLVTFRSVEQSRNWMRRDEILSSAQTVFLDSEAIFES